MLLVGKKSSVWSEFISSLLFRKYFVINHVYRVIYLQLNRGSYGGQENIFIFEPIIFINRKHGLHLSESRKYGLKYTFPDSKVHGANMGPTSVLSAPDGPHVGPMNLAIRLLQTWTIRVQWDVRPTAIEDMLATSSHNMVKAFYWKSYKNYSILLSKNMALKYIQY